MNICPFAQDDSDTTCVKYCALNRGGQCAITIIALTLASYFLNQKPRECPDEIAAFVGDISVKGSETDEPPKPVTDDDIPS